MEKLKTLMDFGETCYEHIGDKVYTDKELRAEAQKWIKKLEDTEIKLGVFELSTKPTPLKYTTPGMLLDAFIEYFFNIEELEANDKSETMTEQLKQIHDIGG